MNPEVIIKRPKRLSPELMNRPGQFRSLAERVARDSFCYKNYLCVSAQNAKPDDRLYWYVDRFYPYAHGGTLFIDEPIRQHEIEDCKKKAELFKELGLRYLILWPNIVENDIYNQIGEF